MVKNLETYFNRNLIRSENGATVPYQAIFCGDLLAYGNPILIISWWFQLRVGILKFPTERKSGIPNHQAVTL